MQSEAHEQIRVIKWSEQPHIRSQWPELALLYHIKNETTEGAKQVMIDRKMGVKKGVPDLFLPVARGKYHGLYIEMKTDTGRCSEAQHWWRDHLLAQGYMWECCHGWQSAASVLEWYMQLKDGDSDV